MPSTILSLTAALAFSLNYASSFASPAPSHTVPASPLSACAASLNAQLPSPTPPNFHFSGNVRRFYVAAEEELWDYAPTGWDNWLGVPFNLSPRAQNVGNVQYGQTWLKALYRGYTDATFTERSEQPPWQGTQGPTLRAEVGDLIEIMFVNNLSKNYATMHSMGLQYSKYSEGADYPNNTMPDVNVVLPEAEAVPPIDHGVAPGGCVVYKWMVSDIAGPNFGEPARTHSYHSYVALQEDTNAGLIGPTIIYAPGQMNQTMATYREFPLLYMIYDESSSWLSGENAAVLQNSGSWEQEHSHHGPQKAWHDAPSEGGRNDHHYGVRNQSEGIGEGALGLDSTQTLWSGNQSVWLPQLVNLQGSGQFMGAPSFHTLNGYVFANNPPYEMCFNDNAIWYINGYGSASHVFHMHGNSFVYNNASEYAISINDGVGKTLYMSASGVGLWQVLCHVNNHQSNGMLNNYRVYKPGQCPLPPLAPAPNAVV